MVNVIATTLNCPQLKTEISYNSIIRDKPKNIIAITKLLHKLNITKGDVASFPLFLKLEKERFVIQSCQIPKAKKTSPIIIIHSSFFTLCSVNNCTLKNIKSNQRTKRNLSSQTYYLNSWRLSFRVKVYLKERMEIQ